MTKNRTTIDLESLGLSTDELQARVVEHVANQILTTVGIDDEGEPHYRTSEFARKAERAITETIDAKVQEIAEREILPKVASMVENLTFTPTNRYGEKQGEPVSFIEHLVARAENWITEQVDFQGKPKSNGDYNWRGKQTRIAHMIHEHLHYNVDAACKAAIKDLNAKVANGIEATVKATLKSVLDSMSVKVAP